MRRYLVRRIPSTLPSLERCPPLASPSFLIGLFRQSDKIEATAHWLIPLLNACSAKILLRRQKAIRTTGAVKLCAK